MYGDITSRSLMGATEFSDVRRAVVSPEDTFVSAGGGVAYQLLEKAGSRIALNELAKFAPIRQRTIAVTSGGGLPVHHIFHAATIKLDETGAYSVSKADVVETVGAILDTALVLTVGIVWVPLLRCWCGISPAQRFFGRRAGRGSHLGSVGNTDQRSPGPLRIAIVIYQERQLARARAADAVGKTLGGAYTVTRQSAPGETRDGAAMFVSASVRGRRRAHGVVVPRGCGCAAATRGRSHACGVVGYGFHNRGQAEGCQDAVVRLREHGVGGKFLT